MLGSAVLDVAIGLAFVYLLLALICTTLNEWLAGAFKWRAKTLEQGIQRLLHSPHGSDGLAEQLYEHPLIKAQAPREGTRPSYISPRAFALALMDIVAEKKPNTTLHENLTQGIAKFSEGTKKSLLAVLKDPNATQETPPQQIEAWFNDQMDRVSGWYKRKMQVSCLILAAIVVILANADTVQIATRLWQNPALRAAIVEQAKARTQMAPPPEYTDAESPAPTPPKSQGAGANAPAVLTPAEKEELAELASWPQEIKRFHEEPHAEWLLSHLLGWGLSIVAVSLGAPFWFDVLSKFMKIRAAGEKPGEKDKTGQKEKKQ